MDSMCLTKSTEESGGGIEEVEGSELGVDLIKTHMQVWDSQFKKCTDVNWNYAQSKVATAGIWGTDSLRWALGRDSPMQSFLSAVSSKPSWQRQWKEPAVLRHWPSWHTCPTRVEHSSMSAEGDGQVTTDPKGTETSLYFCSQLINRLTLIY